MALRAITQLAALRQAQGFQQAAGRGRNCGLRISDCEIKVGTNHKALRRDRGSGTGEGKLGFGHLKFETGAPSIGWGVRRTIWDLFRI